MADPRKSIHQPIGEERVQIRETVHRHLLECTDKGCIELKCNGLSFVLVGLSLWLEELSEIDHAATTRLTGALGVLLDPKANEGQRRLADSTRFEAVKQICAAADVKMAEPGGHA